MKVQYRYVTGETIEVEVDEALAQEIKAMEKDAFNHHRTETRRHTSLHTQEAQNGLFFDGDDPFLYMIRQDEVECIRDVVDRLNSKQRDLLYALYLSDNTISQAEYAAQLGIAEASVKQSAWRARIALKKLWDKV